MTADEAAAEWFAEFVKEMREDFGRETFSLKPDNRIRLLRLRLWTERYHVSLRYVLEKLLSKFSRSPKGIGMAIPTLCGPRAEEWLRECIRRDFPDGENVNEWREDLKQKIAPSIEGDTGDSLKNYSTVSDYAKSYLQEMEQRRRKPTNPEQTQPYRNNPWLQ